MSLFWLLLALICQSCFVQSTVRSQRVPLSRGGSEDDDGEVAVQMFTLLRADLTANETTFEIKRAELKSMEFLARVPGAPTSICSCTREQQVRVGALLGLADVLAIGEPSSAVLLLKLMTTIMPSVFFQSILGFLADPPAFSSEGLAQHDAHNKPHAQRNNKLRTSTNELARKASAAEAFDYVAFHALFLLSTALGPASNNALGEIAPLYLIPHGFAYKPVDALLLFARRESTAAIPKVSLSTQVWSFVHACACVLSSTCDTSFVVIVCVCVSVLKTILHPPPSHIGPPHLTSLSFCNWSHCSPGKRLALLALDRFAKCESTRTALYESGRLDHVLSALSTSRDEVRNTNERLAKPVPKAVVHDLKTGPDGRVTLEQVSGSIVTLANATGSV
jgi:hypothetical protein